MEKANDSGKMNANGGLLEGEGYWNVSSEFVESVIARQYLQNGMEPPKVRASTIEKLTECFNKADGDIMESMKLTEAERIAALTQKGEDKPGKRNFFQILQRLEAEAVIEEYLVLLEKSDV